MTVKFSPGPWSINKTRKYDGNYGRKSGAIIDANGEPIVLFDPSDGEYFPALDEDSPDTNLIAAAPDLLEALKALTHSLNVEDLLHDDQRSSFAAACAAIAKATYKEP